MSHGGITNLDYLFINGIEPTEEVELGNGVTLIQSVCEPSQSDIISKCKNEIDIGVACLFLRLVHACFRISGDSQKEIASRSWNAQWDALLLSAILDCEVGWNFQSDVLPEEFSKATRVHITNYFFEGFNKGEVKQLSQAEHKWINEYYGNAKELMDDERYQNAIHCLASYRWHSMSRAQLTLLWSGIEGLFGVQHELSFRLSLYIARFLSPRKSKRQKNLFESTKKLYNIRSKAVHGSGIKSPTESVMNTTDILRKLVLKCAETHSLPNIDNLAP